MVNLADNTADEAVPAASDEDLDAALNRAKTSSDQSLRSRSAAPEADEGDESDEVSLSGDEPEDNEVEDEEDDLSSFLNEIEGSDSSPESNEAQPEDEGSDDEGVDLSKLSRRQRGKIIEQLKRQEGELRAKLEEEQKERQRLEEEQRNREQEDQRLQADIAKALGTDSEYDRVMQSALDPYADEETKTKARIWTNNRKFYGKLLAKSQRDVRDKFLAVWQQTTQSLPGVDQSAMSGSLTETLQHIYAAGYVQGESAKDKEIVALKKKIDTLEARTKTARRTTAAVTTRNPVSGGQAVPTKKQMTLHELLYADDGLPSDKSERLIRNGDLDLSRVTRQR